MFDSDPLWTTLHSKNDLTPSLTIIVLRNFTFLKEPFFKKDIKLITCDNWRFPDNTSFL